MDALVRTLDQKLRSWQPETSQAVRDRVAELIELADHDLLSLMRSRSVEQEVLDLIDEPPAR